MSSVNQFKFNFSDLLDYAAALNIAQHHGYLTPLLDWTQSPYVAAFFAFRKIYASSDIAMSKENVRIFRLNAAKCNHLPKINTVFPTLPHLTIIAHHHYENPRAIPQQSVSTFTNVDDIESHILSCEKVHQVEFIEAIDLPISIRDTVMRELDFMGINAGSMFPTLDGAFESQRERNFNTI